MRVLYIDCGMGAAGDMLTSALLGLTDNVDAAVEELNAMGIPGIRYIADRSVKCGITGTHVRVLVNSGSEDADGHESHIPDDHHHYDQDHEDHHHEHDGLHHDHNHDHHEHDDAHGHHTHSSLKDIGHIINEHIHAEQKVKEQMLRVFNMLADAESAVHGVPVSDIHFHEVGTMDAVADIAAVCFLLDHLRVDRIYASPVHVGRGTVKCAHGVLPIPAPATARILTGIPIYSTPQIEGELCTPTGAALLRAFVSEFREMPQMTCDRIGYGMGTKDFPRANCVRVFLGDTSDNAEDIYELCFSVDDMTGEEIGFATEKLLAGGARDVFTTAIGMKKGRPGVLITVIASGPDRERLIRLIFKHTTTLGIRENLNHRYVLERNTACIDTEYGVIRRKDASGYGVSRSKYEYEDLSRIASERDCSFREIQDSAERSYEK